MAENKNQEKQDVYDPSSFTYVLSDERKAILEDPDLRKEKAFFGLRLTYDALILLCGLFVLIGAPILLATGKSFDSYGPQALVGLILFGLAILFFAVVDILWRVAAQKKKESACLSVLSNVRYPFGLFGLFSAFGLILIRPSVLDTYKLSSNVFPYASFSGYILLAVFALLFVVGLVLSLLHVQSTALSLTSAILLLLSPYMVLPFYPVLQKGYVLSPSFPPVFLFVFSAVVLSLAVLGKLLIVRKKFPSALLPMAFSLTMVLDASAIIFYGLDLFSKGF